MKIGTLTLTLYASKMNNLFVYELATIFLLPNIII